MSYSQEHLISLLKEASLVFRQASKRTKILATLSWKPKVAREFFKKKESQLPSPTYEIDRPNLEDSLRNLQQFTSKLKGDHPVFRWLSRTHESMINGIRLLLEVESDSFFEIGSELYGNSGTKSFEGQVTNHELAQSISNRLSVCSLSVNDIAESFVVLNAHEFGARLEKKLTERTPIIPVKIEYTDDIVAKVVAGMGQVRIRNDARFSEMDISALWNHEIESHCLTAQNGSRQINCEFLSSGGPRTTLTQEGLAVFHEIYGHSMSQNRFISLCDRVEAIQRVESGADFIEVYRWYKEKTHSEMEAFYNTQRIFRGGKLTGRAPFTKDVVYLAGLLGVYNFLRIAVKNQNRVLIESLVGGRISLEDVGVIAWLRTHGILEPPRYEPEWLKNWEALLSFFSFSAFLDSINLSNFQGYFDDHTHETWDLSL